MSNQAVTVPVKPVWRRSWTWGQDESVATIADWLLRRETPCWPLRLPNVLVLLPVVLACAIASWSWPGLRPRITGQSAFRELAFAAFIAVFGGGIQLAARAICWQISSEMRELVRLTGVNLRMLLWTATLVRWWMIGWSVLLLVPLALFAVTLGGVQAGQWLGIGYGLTLLASLIAGFGMLTSVLVANARNHERATSSMTFLSLILYNMAFSALSMLITIGDLLFSMNRSPYWEELADRISQAAPSLSIRLALFSNILFDPSEPGYWLHYFTATLCAVLATLLVNSKFASSVDPTPDSAPSWRSSPTTARRANTRRPAAVASPDSLAPALSGRPRCSDRPFFWKDIYILSQQRHAINVWTLLYCAAAIGIIAVNVVLPETPDQLRVAAVSVISLLWAGVIISLRFDALLTCEFRERTWGSLMLLPVDPVSLLWTKLFASVWEQRFVALPVLIAQFFVLRHANPSTIGISIMVSLFAVGACGILCQMSCINHFLNKAWWTGPCQALGCGIVIVTMIVAGNLIGDWPGAITSALLLMGIVAFLQVSCVIPLARNWIEP